VRFSQVDSNLLRGGEPSPKHLELLKKIGIKRIVSLDQEIGEEIDPFCKKNNIQHITLPLQDGESSAVKFLPLVAKALNDVPTYVHCRLGRDRTGMAIAIYRMLVNGWSLKDALTEAKGFGMGNGMSDEASKTFYDAVKSFGRSGEDINNGLSIVDIQRDEFAFDQRPPGVDDQSKANPLLKSLAPYGSADNFGGTTEIYIDEDQSSMTYPYWNSPQKDKLWDLTNRIYKYCQPSDALSRNKLWYADPASAKAHAEGNLKNAKMFTALISPLAKGITHPSNANKRLVHDAMFQGYDIVCFVPIMGIKEALVINPTAITDLQSPQEREGEDVNNNMGIPLQPGVQNFAQYNGLAQYNFPGSSAGMSGLMEGVTGGLAGVMTLPYGLNF